jgi:hypothetical protein
MAYGQTIAVQNRDLGLIEGQVTSGLSRLELGSDESW